MFIPGRVNGSSRRGWAFALGLSEFIASTAANAAAVWPSQRKWLLDGFIACFLWLKESRVSKRIK